MTTKDSALGQNQKKLFILYPRLNHFSLIISGLTTAYLIQTIQPKKKDHKSNPAVKFARACPISPIHRKKIGPKRKAPKKTFQLRMTIFLLLEGL